MIYGVTEQDRSIRWDDKDINIDWPLKDINCFEPTLSENDSKAPFLKNAKSFLLNYKMKVLLTGGSGQVGREILKSKPQRDRNNLSHS